MQERLQELKPAGGSSQKTSSIAANIHCKN
jgi:hypothetical protein